MYEYRGISYLRNKLDHKRVRVNLRYEYYESKKTKSDKGLLIPSWMRDMYRSTVGWCARGVDSLADRLTFIDFDRDTDLFDVNSIFEMNNPDLLFDSAIRESMIGSCAFAHVTHGEGEEKMPRISILTANNATGVMDEFTGMLKEGYAILERDKNGHPTVEAYFTVEGTQYYEKGQPTVFEENPGRYPLLVPIPYRPSSRRPFGHSRISRACMAYQRYAETTIERSEISAEFYSTPQRYVTGLDPDADPLEPWRASLSAMLRFDKDEDGGSPSLGQFPQMAMTPFIDELKMAASLFGGETGLTLDDLGFVQANPSSAEAIKASHETLRLMARKAQRTYASAFANIGFVAASVRDEMPYNRSIVTGMRARWEPIFEPDASAMSVVGDGVIKINQAVPNYFTKDNLRELTGIEAEDNEPVSVEEAEEELIE